MNHSNDLWQYWFLLQINYFVSFNKYSLSIHVNQHLYVMLFLPAERLLILDPLLAT